MNRGGIDESSTKREMVVMIYEFMERHKIRDMG